MKTIAISIDEETLAALDRVARRKRGGGGARRGGQPSRSEIVRQAVREFLARREQGEREQRERAIWARHRDRLEREARALVREQATP
jgi:metal-responsive CopG/Arc/MetJ family transcriptional regulator